MKLLKLVRAIKEGWKNFTRHGWLSFAAISIITFSLYVIGITSALTVAANLTIQNIQKKVNISVYFNTEVAEEEIIEIKKDLENYQEIQLVEYVSKNQALDEFLEMESDSSVSEALEEIGENPLLSSLTIVAYDPEQYEIINEALVNSTFSPKINQINFERNKSVIADLNRTVGFIEKAGLALGIIFFVIAVMITFNAVRLSIYSRKQEFEIMRLVGASNLYVQIPSVVEGILYGVSAAVLSSVLLVTTLKLADAQMKSFFGEESFLVLKNSYLYFIIGINLLSGIFLGVVSSFIAIRKHLKV